MKKTITHLPFSYFGGTRHLRAKADIAYSFYDSQQSTTTTNCPEIWNVYPFWYQYFP